MRKVSFFFTLAVVASLLVVGCKKEQGEVVRLGVKMEQSAVDNKMYINTTTTSDNNTRYTPTFESGDLVNINGTQCTIMTRNNGDFYVDASSADGFYAVYPDGIGSFDASSVSGFNVTLPRHQVYQTTTVGGAAKQKVDMPCVAQIAPGTTGSVLHFYNLCSLLEVQWTNTLGQPTEGSNSYQITGIEVTAVNGTTGVGLCGAGTVNFSAPQTTSSESKDGTTVDYSTNPLLTMTDPHSNRVFLDIPIGSRETVHPGQPSRPYYIVLPPFANCTVTVNIRVVRVDGQDNVDEEQVKSIRYATTGTVSLSRAKIVPMHYSAEPKQDNELSGYFSISSTMKVVFSRGNLQHIGSTSYSTGTWKFADRQYDFYGGLNLNGYGDQITTTRDLFCWSETELNSTMRYGFYVYDPWVVRGQGRDTTHFLDWGKRLTISGDAPGTWFTMTSLEWYYLFHLRANGPSLRGKAKITGISGHPATEYKGGTWVERDHIEGFILLPDDWTDEDLPTDLTFSSTDENTYTVSQWARMEAAGAMFLPAAGYGSNDEDAEQSDEELGDIFSTYEEGRYWSATRHQISSTENSNEAEFVRFNYSTARWYLQVSSTIYSNTTVYANYDNEWWHGCSVRLVKPAPGYTASMRAVDPSYKK